MAADQETVDRVRSIDVEAYKYGFISAIEFDMAPKGLSETRSGSFRLKKEEPEWLLEWRLEAFRRWLTMDEPKWARVSYPPIDYQDIYYFAAPKSSPRRGCSTKSIRSSCGPTLSSASRLWSRRSLPGSRGRGWRSTPFSIWFRSRRPSRRSSPRRASSSAVLRGGP